MKQTAVKWLVDQLFELRNPTLNQIEIMEQAKEMETRQIGYSEEDIREAFLAGVEKESYKGLNFDDWFEKFKKK